MKMLIAVFGSSGDVPPSSYRAAWEIGIAIACAGCGLVTGACSGVSAAASEGAASQGGQVIGVSPAASLQEHSQTYGLPSENIDVLVLTGFGFKGRNVIAARTAHAAIIVSGGIGTLNEFTIAFDENRPIGVLEGTGGVADLLPNALAELVVQDTRAPHSDRTVIIDSDPKTLVDRLLAAVSS